MSDEYTGKGSAQLSAIPILNGMGNWATFEHTLTNYLSSIGAASLVDGTEVEPFRRHVAGNADVRPKGTVAGSAPPRGALMIDPNRLTDADGFSPFPTPQVPQLQQPPRQRVDALSRDELDEWRRWSRRESMARSAIVLKVPKSIYAPFAALWSTKDVFDALKTKVSGRHSGASEPRPAKDHKCGSHKGCNPRPG